MGDDPGTVSAADQAEWVERFFFDSDGNPVPTGDGAVRGEIVEHLPGGATRSTLFGTKGHSAAV